MKEDELIGIVSRLYHASTGRRPDAETKARLQSAVEAALSIKKCDADLFHGLVAAGLVEVRNMLKLGENPYVGQLIKYYAVKSAYLKPRG